MSRPRTTMVLLAAALLAAVVMVVALLVTRPDQPSDTSPAVGFTRDMIDHHAQAVQMASLIHERGPKEDVSYLSLDIMLTQTNQMGQMQAWLNAWDLPLGRTGAAMDWMGASDHHHMAGPAVSSSSTDPALPRDASDPMAMALLPDGRMPGMASAADIKRLTTLPLPQAEVLFLRLMIVHHEAALNMAQMVEPLTDDPLVTAFAASTIKAQSAEISAMTTMLRSRGVS